MNILDINKTIEDCGHIVVPTSALPAILSQAETHMTRCIWHITVNGKQTVISKTRRVSVEIPVRKDYIGTCPFCGREMKAYTQAFPCPRTGIRNATFDGWHFVACPGGMCCPVAPRTANCMTREQAIAVWQKATEKHGKEIQKLTEARDYYKGICNRLFEWLERNHNEIYKNYHQWVYENKQNKESDIG